MTDGVAMYHESYWLNVYSTSSGQWAGQVSKGDEVVCGISGCRSPADVERAAYDQFPEIEEVVLGSVPVLKG